MRPPLAALNTTMAIELARRQSTDGCDGCARNSTTTSPWTEYRSEAISRKRLSARRLAEAGFHVRCDGRIYTCTPGERQPFTRHELDAVAGQFDEHVRGILDEALRPLSALDVAHVLRWTRQDRSVRDLVPTPNEHVGRFAYVSERAVLARLLDVFGGRLATMTHTPKGPGQPWTSASGPAERPAAVPAPASRRLR
jgi:hypothetical protein